jgi:hypothetical protein
LSIPHLITKLFTSITDVPKQDWDSVINERNIYLSRGYLISLEQGLTKSIDFYYSISYNKEEEPVLLGVFQNVRFVYKKRSKRTLVLKPFSEEISATEGFAIRILVCGNVFATGETGFAHTKSLSAKEALNQLRNISESITPEGRIRKEFSIVLFKELWPESVQNETFLLQNGFNNYNIDVNMLMEILPTWSSFDDYLESIKAKYRTKANAVFKRSQSLSIKSLSTEEIQKHATLIATLHKNVLATSDYSFGALNAATFVALKQNLKDTFLFKGVFYNSKMVGFSTAIVNNTTLEANHIGLDYIVNVERAVYQRLLYDFLDEAIALKMNQLQLGRTSELIKSALGAVPVDMTLYAKHTNKVGNLVLSKILNTVSPSEYSLRKPYKNMHITASDKAKKTPKPN